MFLWGLHVSLREGTLFVRWCFMSRVEIQSLRVFLVSRLRREHGRNICDVCVWCNGLVASREASTWEALGSSGS